MSEFVTNGHKIEVLAPGGSAEGIYAALNCGADAVYAGGQMFGARAYAENPDTGMLTELIREVHLRGKKLYLTVNTLLKPQELENSLVRYLEPFYVNGLDAAIVQDFGVWMMLRKYFPELPLHASTQMTVVSADFAKLLKAYGATRIVPARELSLEEIKKIKCSCDIEVETFVHGALCYCYSGQCLMSSMIGGRSGNRGRCAQPCRLPYQFGGHGKYVASKGGMYLLSPKDICTLELIPDLADAGIDSLKIEGRMKKPEYAAMVSSIYRKYVDLYLERGRDGYQVQTSDVTDLMDLYNRGGFTTGYYGQHNGRTMMSFKKPNHWGTPAATVLKVTPESIFLKAKNQLDPQDVLEISDGDMAHKPVQWTLKEGVLPGRQFIVRAVRGMHLKPGMTIYRMRHESLVGRIRKMAAMPQNKEKLYAYLRINKDFPVTMTVIYGDLSVKVTGPVAAPALQRAVTKADIVRQLSKTGGTRYMFESIEVAMTEDIFVPLSALNRMRREAFEQLEAAVLKRFERQTVYDTDAATDTAVPVYKYPDTVPELGVLVSDMACMDVVAGHEDVSVIYLEYDQACHIGRKAYEALAGRLHEKGKRLYLALPHMMRAKNHFEAEKLTSDTGKILGMAEITDGILARNMEGLLLFKNHGYQGEIVADARVYTWNRKAEDFVRLQGASVLTVPEELNYKELSERDCEGGEMIVYGYRPLMISAQCLLKNTDICKKEAGKKSVKRLEPPYTLTDRTGRQMRVVPCCEDCYNLIYNSEVLDLCGEAERIRKLALKRVRVELTGESAREAKQVLDDAAQAFVHGRTASGEQLFQTKRTGTGFTKGHFKRGVE